MRLREIEEERRLVYVAMTRARKRLVLTAHRNALRDGKERNLEPSRFLVEAGLRSAPGRGQAPDARGQATGARRQAPEVVEEFNPWIDPGAP